MATAKDKKYNIVIQIGANAVLQPDAACNPRKRGRPAKSTKDEAEKRPKPTSTTSLKKLQVPGPSKTLQTNLKKEQKTSSSAANVPKQSKPKDSVPKAVAESKKQQKAVPESKKQQKAVPESKKQQQIVGIAAAKKEAKPKAEKAAAPKLVKLSLARKAELKKMCYQFKISLLGTKVWRRIQVDGKSTFADLFSAIAGAFGWIVHNLHDFQVVNPSTGNEEKLAPVSDMQRFGKDQKDEQECLVLDYFISPDDRALLTYTYSDSWEHLVVFEKTLVPSARAAYPKCIAGAMACPPYECGGVNAYNHLVEVLKNPAHPEHSGYIRWLAIRGLAGYNPKEFQIPKSRYVIVPRE